MRSGTVHSQKNISSGRVKRCILTRRARPKEGFLGYGAAYAMEPVIIKSLPYLSFDLS